MSFDDFEKESAKLDARLYSIAVVTVILLVVGAAFYYHIANRRLGVEQEPDAATRRATRLESVKNLCQNLPVPEQFVWEKETLTQHNDDLTVLFETYRSKRTSVEVMPFFQVWFSSNGWIKSDTQKGRTTSAVVITFHKGNQEISIFSSDFTGFHDIQCQEREVKKL